MALRLNLSFSSLAQIKVVLQTVWEWLHQYVLFQIVQRDLAPKLKATKKEYRLYFQVIMKIAIAEENLISSTLNPLV